MSEAKEESKVLKAKPEGKPNVLILGGVGFIGRNLVKRLVDNDLASHIRVADKAMPGISYLNPEHKAAFDEKNIVQFVQCDLTKDDHVTNKAFKDDVKFNIVVNLCGETRFGLSEADYKLKCEQTAEKCVAAAKAAGVERWVEVSTAQVYEPASKKPATEESKLKPWTMQATYRLKAEEIVKASGIPHVTLRPVYVYGPGDLTGLTPRITCAAAYVKLGEKMENLWGKELKLNVVHVDDVVEAIWRAATEFKPGSVYNLADEADLNQGTLNGWLGELFKIKTGFFGSIVSNAARLSMGSVAASANDKHLPAFSKLCAEHKILNTPINPLIDKELLYNNHLYIDGSKITKESDFKYKHRVSLELLREQVEYFIRQGIFPPIL